MYLLMPPSWPEVLYSSFLTGFFLCSIFIFLLKFSLRPLSILTNSVCNSASSGLVVPILFSFFSKIWFCSFIWDMSLVSLLCLPPCICLYVLCRAAMLPGCGRVALCNSVCRAQWQSLPSHLSWKLNVYPRCVPSSVFEP